MTQAHNDYNLVILKQMAYMSGQMTTLTEALIGLPKLDLHNAVQVVRSEIKLLIDKGSD